LWKASRSSLPHAPTGLLGVHCRSPRQCSPVEGLTLASFGDLFRAVFAWVGKLHISRRAWARCAPAGQEPAPSPTSCPLQRPVSMMARSHLAGYHVNGESRHYSGILDRGLEQSAKGQLAVRLCKLEPQRTGPCVLGRGPADVRHLVWCPYLIGVIQRRRMAPRR